MVTGVWRPISCVSISESKLYLLKGGMWRWYQIVVAFLAPIALLSNTYLRLLSSASVICVCMTVAIGLVCVLYNCTVVVPLERCTPYKSAWNTFHAHYWQVRRSCFLLRGLFLSEWWNGYVVETQSITWNVSREHSPRTRVL
ncbi:hypothetical protein Ae201684P_022040 [Aphanomyces euteiches]|nr:hypothetical protein Ae201684P_022040 [Aphanomyces euteiches]